MGVGKEKTTPLGIEPRISGSVDQRLIHWATESTVHFNYQGHIELIRPITRIADPWTCGSTFAMSPHCLTEPLGADINECRR